MAIRATGMKFNDKEVENFVNRLLEKQVKRYIAAGDKAQKEIRTKYTIDWFLHGSTTMADSLEFTHKIVQKNGMATLYFTSYVNMSRFATITAFKDTSIYRWTTKYHAGINPAEFLLDLQWNQGIHGLPKEWTRPNPRFGQTLNNPPWFNPYYNQGISLRNYINMGFKKEWESTVNRLLKK